MTKVFLFALFFSCSLAFASASAASDGWNRFYNAFSTMIGGETEGLTFMTTPKALGSDLGSTGAFEAYTLCDAVPDWSFSYKPVGSVFRGYKEMTDSLLFEANKDAMDRAAAQAIVVQNNQQMWATCVESLASKWENFHRASPKMTYEDWYAQLGAPMCEPKRQLWVTSNAQYQTLLQAAVHSGYDYVLQAWSDLADPNNYMSVFDGTNTRNVSICTMAPTLLSTVSNWQNGQLNPGSFSVTSAEGTENKWSVSAEGGAGFFFDPVLIEGGGSGTRVGIDTSESDFSMTVSWKGLQQLSFSRGGWWNAALVQGHKDGPWSPDSPIAKGTTHLWGPGGTLGLVPSSAVVIYQPTITLQLSQSDYHELQTSWTQESGACIFIFCFESESHHQDTQISWHDDSFSVDISDTSQIAKVVAIINTVNEPDELAAATQGTPFSEGDSQPLISVDASDFRALSSQGVQMIVRPDKVQIRPQGDSCKFAGELVVSGIAPPPVPAPEAVPPAPLLSVSCNDGAAFPTFTATQWACLNNLGGFKKDTTSSNAWDFWYRSAKNKDLAHMSFTHGTAGVQAHFTCRSSYPNNSGHHVGAIKGRASQWVNKGCCSGRGWPSSVQSDMVWLITTVSSCL